ncbi:MAG: pyridoxamine 5'-phosphate oxidase family protein [Pseudomonadota bacterium]
MSLIDTEEGLRALYGPPMEKAVLKEIDHIDGHCRAWLAAAPFILLATTDGTRLDVSPKGDAPGFVQVEDEETLLIPDWPGNNRIDGLSNIVRDPQVALIAVVPNVKETLRVNGRATIHDDEDLRARFETRGKLPITVTRIAVEEVFMHCPKAFMRSGLWDAATWPERSALPTMGEVLKDHAGLEGPPETADAQLARSLKQLY